MNNALPRSLLRQAISRLPHSENDKVEEPVSVSDIYARRKRARSTSVAALLRGRVVAKYRARLKQYEGGRFAARARRILVCRVGWARGRVCGKIQRATNAIRRDGKNSVESDRVAAAPPPVAVHRAVKDEPRSYYVIYPGYCRLRGKITRSVRNIDVLSR